MGDDDDAVCRTCGDGLAIDDEELEEQKDESDQKEGENEE